MSIHATIRHHRLRLGLTEQQLADRVDVTRAAVQQWERENGTAPKRSKQEAVAAALEISLAELLGMTASAAPLVVQEPAKTYILERAAWPFETVPRELWDALTERQKGEIEFQIKQLAGIASGYVQQDKAQKMAC